MFRRLILFMVSENLKPFNELFPVAELIENVEKEVPYIMI